MKTTTEVDNGQTTAAAAAAAAAGTTPTAPATPPQATRAAQAPALCPRSDIRESEDHFEIQLEMPGVSSQDVEVSLVDDELKIRAIRVEPKAEKYVIRERRIGAYSRVFRLGTLVDRERVEGKLTDGVLTLRLPKHRNALPRRIQVI